MPANDFWNALNQCQFSLPGFLLTNTLGGKHEREVQGLRVKGPHADKELMRAIAACPSPAELMDYLPDRYKTAR